MLSPLPKPCATLVVTVTMPLPVGRVIELIVRDTADEEVSVPPAGEVGVSSVARRSKCSARLPSLTQGVRLVTL